MFVPCKLQERNQLLRVQVLKRRAKARALQDRNRGKVLIPGEAAHRNEMMSPVVTE